MSVGGVTAKALGPSCPKYSDTSALSLSLGDQTAVLTAGDGDAGRAVDHVAGGVREEDVQHLCRADAIEDVAVEQALPALANIGG